MYYSDERIFEFYHLVGEIWMWLGVLRLYEQRTFKWTFFDRSTTIDERRQERKEEKKKKKKKITSKRKVEKLWSERKESNIARTSRGIILKKDFSRECTEADKIFDQTI